MSILYANKLHFIMYFMELDGTMLLYNYYDDRYGIVPFRVNFGRRSRTEVENPAGRVY